MPPVTIRKVKLRQHHPRRKPSERTYAHEADLYRKRGYAPSRDKLLYVLFAVPGRQQKRLNFAGPTTTAYDYVNNTQPQRREVDIRIDYRQRLYFFEQGALDNMALGDDLHGYYLLQSTRRNDGPPINEGNGTLTFYQVDHQLVKELVPVPSAEQRQNTPDGLRRCGLNAIRFYHGKWKEVYERARADSNANKVTLSVRNVTRKGTKTTGRIYVTRT